MNNKIVAGKPLTSANTGEEVAVRGEDGVVYLAKALTPIVGGTVLVTEVEKGEFRAIASVTKEIDGSAIVRRRRPRKVKKGLYPFQQIVVFDAGGGSRLIMRGGFGDESQLDLSSNYTDFSRLHHTGLEEDDYFAVLAKFYGGSGSDWIFLSPTGDRAFTSKASNAFAHLGYDFVGDPEPVVFFSPPTVSDDGLGEFILQTPSISSQVNEYLLNQDDLGDIHNGPGVGNIVYNSRDLSFARSGALTFTDTHGLVHTTNYNVSRTGTQTESLTGDLAGGLCTFTTIGNTAYTHSFREKQVNYEETGSIEETGQIRAVYQDTESTASFSLATEFTHAYDNLVTQDSTTNLTCVRYINAPDGSEWSNHELSTTWTVDLIATGENTFTSTIEFPFDLGNGVIKNVSQVTTGTQLTSVTSSSATLSPTTAALTVTYPVETTSSFDYTSSHYYVLLKGVDFLIYSHIAQNHHIECSAGPATESVIYGYSDLYPHLYRIFNRVSPTPASPRAITLTRDPIEQEYSVYLIDSNKEEIQINANNSFRIAIGGARDTTHDTLSSLPASITYNSFFLSFFHEFFNNSLFPTSITRDTAGGESVVTVPNLAMVPIVGAEVLLVYRDPSDPTTLWVCEGVISSAVENTTMRFREPPTAPLVFNPYNLLHPKNAGPAYFSVYNIQYANINPFTVAIPESRYNNMRRLFDSITITITSKTAQKAFAASAQTSLNNSTVFITSKSNNWAMLWTIASSSGIDESSQNWVTKEDGSVWCYVTQDFFSDYSSEQSDDREVFVDAYELVNGNFIRRENESGIVSPTDGNGNFYYGDPPLYYPVE